MSDGIAARPVVQPGPCVIFDIDGTLADISHRRHHVENRPKNWKAFNAAMHMDKPNEPIVRLAGMFVKQGVPIVACSGREEIYKAQTSIWLLENNVWHQGLYMRKEKDYRADDIVKSELLDQILADGWQPWLVVDDRSRVVEMWRARGLTCLQCAPGDF